MSACTIDTRQDGCINSCRVHQIAPLPPAGCIKTKSGFFCHSGFWTHSLTEVQPVHTRVQLGVCPVIPICFIHHCCTELFLLLWVHLAIVWLLSLTRASPRNSCRICFVANLSCDNVIICVALVYIVLFSSTHSLSLTYMQMCLSVYKPVS